MSQGWSDDDAFWAAFEPFLFSPGRMESAPGEIDALLALVELPARASILDQAVGVGRHAAELLRRDLAVTGIDRTERYLARARELAPEAELVSGDMRSFCRDGAFDAVFNLWTSFGFFSEEENQLVAQNAFDSLKPGGAYVLEMMGKEIMAAAFVPNRHMWQGEHLFIEDSRVSDGWARTHSKWTIVDDEGKRASKEIDIRCYSGVEIQQLLWKVGFDDVEVFGSLEGIPYDTDAERLVVVAHKP